MALRQVPVWALPSTCGPLFQGHFPSHAQWLVRVGRGGMRAWLPCLRVAQLEGCSLSRAPQRVSWELWANFIATQLLPLPSPVSLTPHRCCPTKWKWSSLSRVWLLVTPWTIAHQAPLSMGFSRQEDWSRLPFPSPDFPTQGWNPGLLHCMQVLYHRTFLQTLLNKAPVCRSASHCSYDMVQFYDEWVAGPQGLVVSALGEAGWVSHQPMSLGRVALSISHVLHLPYGEQPYGCQTSLIF